MERITPLARRAIAASRISANASIHWTWLFLSQCIIQNWNRIDYRRRVHGKWNRICQVSNSGPEVHLPSTFL